MQQSMFMASHKNNYLKSLKNVSGVLVHLGYYHNLT